MIKTIIIDNHGAHFEKNDNRKILWRIGMSDNEVHITTKDCKCKWCKARRNKKRELARAYRLVAADQGDTGAAEVLIAIAERIERELEAEA